MIIAIIVLSIFALEIVYKCINLLIIANLVMTKNSHNYCLL